MRSDRAAMAKYLARAIFMTGDEAPSLGGKVQRIQFMGGNWPAGEIPLGGLNETALAQVILEALKLNDAYAESPPAPTGGERDG